MEAHLSARVCSLSVMTRYGLRSPSPSHPVAIHRHPAAGSAVILLMTEVGLYSLTLACRSVDPVVTRRIAGKVWGLDSGLCGRDSRHCTTVTMATL
ncbi:hypothetical protein VZT92_014037 [Zoarces viviparus]|uniref:Uncharacterized protein n=1 Tax=Zoarces viviparus TaxID=48416 RepID=A0AAW1EYT0_ZOAVI